MNRDIPPIIHLVNLVALLVGSVIVVLAGVTQSYQFVILAPLLLLILGYWRWRTSPQMVATTFGVSLTVLVWILLCEHVVFVDNLFGIQITKRLELGMHLQTFVGAKLKSGRKSYFQAHASDPLLYHYRPGSLYEASFDCATCNAPDQVVVDETGYLNRAPGLWSRQAQIELFVAGDSVLQGLGMPSVMEQLRDQLPVTMWNLSVAGYGPRQKISALLAYALPKRPKWLVVEFYAGNDVSDEIQNDLCDKTHNFHCYFGIPETRHRLVKHPVYRHLIANSDDIFETLAYTAAQNFTLATTRLLIDTLKGTLRRTGSTGTAQEGLLSPMNGQLAERPQYQLPSLPSLPSPPGKIQFRTGHRITWTTVGMALTHTNYERLAAKLATMVDKPTVILLYNPSPYELYRDVLVASNAEFDMVAAFQNEVQRVFAEKHAWQFLDLTQPLRRALRENPMWLYGRYDPSHWSLRGTAIVSSVLGDILLPMIEG